MPIKSETEGLIIPREKDRRIKLTDEQRNEISEKYASGSISMYKLADEYGVSRNTIQYILNPKKYEDNLRKKREKKYSTNSYDREKHTNSVRKIREYRKMLHENGELVVK